MRTIIFKSKIISNENIFGELFKMIEHNLKSLPTFDDLKKIQEEYPEVNPKSVIAVLNFMTVSKRLIKAYGDFFRKFDLTEAKFTVLMLLFRENSHSLSPSEIAHKMGITKSSSTTLIDGLLSKQLIYRKPSDTDRRKLLIKLSPNGKKALNEVLPLHFSKTSSLLSNVSSSELDVFIQVLKKLDIGIKDYVDK